jgi:hypothetical protein
LNGEASVDRDDLRRPGVDRDDLRRAVIGWRGKRSNFFQHAFRRASIQQALAQDSAEQYHFAVSLPGGS